jgi:hypothetical protein
MSMFDPTQLSDDALRAALFDALVERLAAEAQTDPSIAMVNRMPTVFSVSRQGNLLTLSQGIGLWLLRGVLKWRDRRDGLRSFNVGRAPIHSRLVVMPDGVAGTAGEILDWIVAMFLEKTWEQSRTTDTGPPPERRSAPARTARDTPPALVEVAEKSAPPLRTYQLLFEIAQRELKVAKALPADNAKYFLVSAGVSVALTAEAFLNDLGSRVISSWAQLQRLDPREKAEVLNVELFNGRVDWSVSPFHSVAAAFGFRRALAHAHAETLPFDEALAAERSGTEVPRTRRTAWQQHCDVATIERWVSDVRLLIEHFSKGDDPTEVAVKAVEEPARLRSTGKSRRSSSAP